MKQKTLLVASAGGHLEQLWTLWPRLSGVGADCTWVTYDTPQSRSLLRGEQRFFIPEARPRDTRATISHSRLALHVLGLGGWGAVVSTGALPAVPFLTLARARGIGCHFIDSATRVQGPSLSATLLAPIPGIQCYSQYRWPEQPSWHYAGSVFDSYRAEPTEPRGVLRVVVTVGTSSYGFRRLLDGALSAIPPDADVLWQTGRTDTTALPVAPRPFVAEEKLGEAMGEADVVISHAGVGSVLAALAAGRCPVIVPRSAAHHEHVDDHQAQLADELGRRGLAVPVGAEHLTPEVLFAAASRRVVVKRRPPPFVLAETPRAQLRAGVRHTPRPLRRGAAA